MSINTIQPGRKQQRAARRSAARRSIAFLVTAASVPLLMSGPAHAQVESPQGTVVDAKVAPTHVGHLYGVHVEGGWLLR